MSTSIRLKEHHYVPFWGAVTIAIGGLEGLSNNMNSWAELYEHLSSLPLRHLALGLTLLGSLSTAWVRDGAETGGGGRW